ncbi:MAG: F0F1 ATP synthase subunit delta, partial [Lentisphaerae bacterium]|nr:F0F1 ATP synthase subunit delta [Lentisphaerota bacterium]
MLEFSWLSFGFAVINFLVLAALLWRFLHKPLLAALARRKLEIETARQNAAEETTRAEELRKQYEAKLASASADRDELLAEARRTAEAAREKLLADATADARRQAESLVSAAERECNDSLAKLREQVADTVISVAGSVLAGVSDAGIEERLEAALLKELSTVGKSMGAVDDRCPVRVTSAGELGDASREAIASTIKAATGGDPAIEFRKDPDLVAGTRVEFSAMAVDASLGDVLA